MKTLLFVCTGNTCRSPMAKAIGEDLIKNHFGISETIKVDSAGTMACDGQSAADNAIIALYEMNIKAEPHFSKQITAQLIKEADLILTMEARHVYEITALFPFALNKTYTLPEYANRKEGQIQKEKWEIKDPYGLSLNVYMDTAMELKKGIKKAIERFTGEDLIMLPEEII